MTWAKGMHRELETCDFISFWEYKAQKEKKPPE
jgi:hypothetical protein